MIYECESKKEHKDELDEMHVVIKSVQRVTMAKIDST